MDAVVGPVKAFVKAEVFRVIVALSMLASSALVIEAGQRWR
jgi:hypothetical protein